MARVSVTHLRPELTRWIDHVRRSEEYVVLTSHGREVAALVSMQTLSVIWEGQDERRIGPINPATGRPFGRAWVLEHFGGHYERARDPQSHLHPSSKDAPWLGRSFPWPPEESAGPETVAEAPAPARRWWEVWRR
ncbi:type II toxin-antitoxin system Phd/YefM family antitoxin [Roseitranquillus sediminis]|uniref:type II toxin-antitoxin system Phd/YefM family antitoxin n=1 Tax=Roseitranquillus sediminis TaxID=2809051 RepID=UPI001D0CC541|nr:type II toxin-antitoxin system Phd/YefM family antitoxin [Roseitranquillus sediminis]MBM9595545.1 type II toxin-antitoxin system Phd/YefM family antitoxin [Roseitranquillus sediminis]